MSTPAGTRPEPAAPLPLCVDLDGTLVRTDTLVEQVVRVCFQKPWALPSLVAALLGGRARLKRAVGERVQLDAAALPYQEDLVEFLRAEKATGRPLALVTAADSSTAQAVATHLGLFDTVMASDGAVNLKGESKAQALVDKFGKGGYAYAGDSSADLPVWRSAGECILVNASSSVADRISSEKPVARRFGGRPGKLKRLVKEMRVYQWVKNVLVFVPAMLAHTMAQPPTLLAAFLTFIAFSLTASGVYVINDLLDLDSDRRHPRKRKRPFASGDLPLSWGLLGPGLLVAGMALSWIGCSLGTLLMLVIYVVVTNAYSAYLKTRPLVDVFVLAGLYTIRLLAGGVATRTPVSVWLLGFSLFSFLSLAFLKRSSELKAGASEEGVVSKRRGYSLADDGVLQAMGLASAFASAMELSLYLETDAARMQYQSARWLWLMVPLLLFAQCRLWLAASRGYMTDDPIVYAAKDWVSRLVLACAAVVYLVASYGPSPTWFLFR